MMTKADIEAVEEAALEAVCAGKVTGPGYINDQSAYAELFDIMTRDGFKLDLIAGIYRRP